MLTIACWGSTSELQYWPNCLWDIYGTFSQTLEQPDAPDCTTLRHKSAIMRASLAKRAEWHTNIRSSDNVIFPFYRGYRSRHCGFNILVQTVWNLFKKFLQYFRWDCSLRKKHHLSLLPLARTVTRVLCLKITLLSRER